MTTVKRQADIPAQALLGACLLASGFLAWQVYSAPMPVTPDAGQGVSEATIAAPTLPQRPVIEDLARLTTTRQRPLFHTSRRPAPPPPVVLAAPEEKPLTRYRLVGTALFGGNKVALLKPLEGGRVLRAREGQRIGAWRILDIGARSVVMESPAETQRLGLSVDGRPKARQSPVRNSTQRLGDQQPIPEREDKTEEDTVSTE